MRAEDLGLKSVYYSELIEYLNLNESNELVEEYFDAIWNFSNFFDNDENVVTYSKIKISSFLESLTSKVDLEYLEGKLLNWTNVIREENTKLNSILKFYSKEDGAIAYIEDYELLDRIYCYYISKVECN